MVTMRTENKIIYPKLSYKLTGLMYETHNHLGRYRNEKQYADYFEKLLKREKMKYEREKPLPPSFKGESKRRNVPDFIIEDKIIIEFKAKRLITKEDYYQIQRYLSSYNKRLGMIVNFRCLSIKPKRIINPQFKFASFA
jgi:GxxExxY protein